MDGWTDKLTVIKNVDVSKKAKFIFEFTHLKSHQVQPSRKTGNHVNFLQNGLEI